MKRSELPNMSKLITLLALMGAGLLTTHAATLTYNFDDGTLQGWTQIMVGSAIDRGDVPSSNQTAGVFRYDVIANSELLSNTITVGNYLPAGQESAHSGDHRILPTPFYDRDPIQETLMLRSPEFNLDGSGDLTAYLKGGDEAAPPPATSALVPATTTTTGFQGIALRRVSDDAYILFDGKTGNGSDWQQIVFSQAALAAFVSPTETYTLDFIDSAHGGWGWVGLDTVVVPGTAAEDLAFAITEIEYAAADDEVRLTWRSRPGKTYSSFSSTDLADWTNQLGGSLGSAQDENAGDGDHITVTFTLTNGLENMNDLFFRIAEE